MVNNKEFTQRLHKIMGFYELSAASFADRIDVGRSSISHLLSGRNKPSLDFVLKIVHAFPEVDLYWLLNGRGDFPKKEIPPEAKPMLRNTRRDQGDLFSEEEKDTKESHSSVSLPQGKRSIQKIVIFYNDGSFEAFEN